MDLFVPRLGAHGILSRFSEYILLIRSCMAGLVTGRPPSVRVMCLLSELETLILRRLGRLRFCSTNTDI